MQDVFVETDSMGRKWYHMGTKRSQTKRLKSDSETGTEQSVVNTQAAVLCHSMFPCCPTKC